MMSTAIEPSAKARTVAPSRSTKSVDKLGTRASKDTKLIAVRSRYLRELADLDTSRAVERAQIDGLSKKAIAALLNISQADVARRLKRTSLRTEMFSLREVMLRRRVGEITRAKMMSELRQAALATRRPTGAGVFDGAATTSGAARELMRALQEGLLSEGEYQDLRDAAARAGHQ